MYYSVFCSVLRFTPVSIGGSFLIVFCCWNVAQSICSLVDGYLYCFPFLAPRICFDVSYFKYCLVFAITAR